jgi:predicted RNA-binding protein with PIN domain
MTDEKAFRAMRVGFLETASVVAGILAFGLIWAGAGARLAAANAYHPAESRMASGERDVRWLVDGFNVLHAGVLRGNDRQGWWREEMRARLLARVAGFEDEAAELWVVFDGRGPLADAELRSARPRVVFAPSADEWLLAEVREAEDPSTIVVVTADRQLADRARHRGARVVSPRAFLARCGPAS